MKKNLYSNWREDLREVVDTISSKPEKSKNSKQKVEDKEVNNEVKINPVMKEQFEELGGVLLEFVELDEALRSREERMSRMMTDKDRQKQKKERELKAKADEIISTERALSKGRKKNSEKTFNTPDAEVRKLKPGQKKDTLAMRAMEEYEIDEKLNLKKADMGDVVKDFYKSDAPQFKGRSKEERRKMAIAAKLTAERGGKKLGEESAVDLVTDMIRKQQGGTYSELKKKGKLSQPRTQRKPSNTKPTDMTKATDPRPGSRYRGD